MNQQAFACCASPLCSEKRLTLPQPLEKAAQILVAPLKFLATFFVCFLVIFLRVIWWIVLLAYNKKTIHEGTRTITKKHEEESLADFDVGFLFNSGQRSFDIFAA